MKVLVAVKRVPDPNTTIRVKTDRSGIDTSAIKFAANPFDEVAVEEAVRLRERGLAAEIVAVTIGPAAAQDCLRTALAMGADRAVLIETDVEVQPLAVAKLLAALARREAPRMVILGKQAIDNDAGQTGQMLAALLGWPQGVAASQVIPSDGDVEVVREIDGGTETLRLPLPAVITADLRLNEPRYASLPAIMKARKKPIERLAASGLSDDLAPRLSVLAVDEPPARAQGVRLPDVAALVARLAGDTDIVKP